MALVVAWAAWQGTCAIAVRRYGRQIPRLGAESTESVASKMEQIERMSEKL